MAGPGQRQSRGPDRWERQEEARERANAVVASQDLASAVVASSPAMGRARRSLVRVLWSRTRARSAKKQCGVGFFVV